MSQDPIPTDPNALPGALTSDDLSSASQGGCILGIVGTTVAAAFLVLAFTLGRCTAPDPNAKTHAAVCEVLDQLGADDTDGHAREFCP